MRINPNPFALVFLNERLGQRYLKVIHLCDKGKRGMKKLKECFLKEKNKLWNLWIWCSIWQKTNDLFLQKRKFGEEGDRNEWAGSV